MTDLTIIDAMEDPDLWGGHFAGRSWDRWKTFLHAMFALPYQDEEELKLFQQCTGKSRWPTEPAPEAWLACGRRAGKSRILALIAVYLAVYRDYRPDLSVGELATVLVLAADRAQAALVLRYVPGLLRGSLVTEQMIVSDNNDTITLITSCEITVKAVSHRTTRGFSAAAIICDELCFWPLDQDASSSDEEVLTALRPSMLSIPGSRLICASSPYVRRGAMYRAFETLHGNDDVPEICWRAATKTMNPRIPQKDIDKAYAEDPIKAACELGAEWRSDAERFISIDALRAVTPAGVRERAPIPGVKYHTFVDPSGGSQDAMAMAVAHKDERGVVLLDALRVRKSPFNPTHVTAEFAEVAKSYSCAGVVGDRYTGSWVATEFAKHGLRYTVSPKPKSDLFLAMLPMINAGQVSLLDLPAMLNEFVMLERRTGSSGRELVDHVRGGHDDQANSAAGAVFLARYGAAGADYLIEINDRSSVQTLARYEGLVTHEPPPWHRANELSAAEEALIASWHGASS